jgi:LuxR family maltose regulon positive regulatory protein
MEPGLLRALTYAPPAPLATMLDQFVAAMADRALPTVMVLDDLSRIQNAECFEVLEKLIRHVPAGSQIALTSWGRLGLALGPLRAQHGLLEIRAGDLAMTLPEATSLLKDNGIRMPRDKIEELVERTEGWPAALHLSALSLKQGQEDDRFLDEYLNEAILSRLPPRLVTFLTRTAALEQVCGPLCDAVLHASGSSRVLESLEQAGLLVLPADRRRTWYRYHHLFRKLLLSRLDRDEPELVPELLQRAARWCAANLRMESAVDYAMAAGEADLAARLLVETALAVHSKGGVAKLGEWFDWFDQRGLVEVYPAVATLGAWTHINLGDVGAVQRWLAIAERAEREHGAAQEPLPDGSPDVQGWLSLVRAMLCRDGAEQMRVDAEVALALLPLGSPWRPMASVQLGMAYLLVGDRLAAEREFDDAVEEATAAGDDAATVALAERAALAIARGQWTEAEVLTGRACSIVRRGRLEEYVTSVLLYAIAARSAIHRGELAQARENLGRAQRLRGRVTAALPVYAAQTRLELVRAYIALTDLPTARTLLAEVDVLLRERPDLDLLEREADELRAQLHAMSVNAVGPSLTAAELRLLQVLGTHHSFKEIGDQLYLSRHTVKSHAMSIYRKFGVSSRSEAVDRAREVGLLSR